MTKLYLRKIGLLCVLTVFFFLPIETTEDETMTTNDEFIAITGTNDDLEGLKDFKNLALFEDEYYYGSGTANEVYAKKVDSLTGSTTTEDTIDNGDTGVNFTYINSIASVLNDNLYIVHIVYESGAVDGWVLVHKFDGTTWTQSTFNINSTTYTIWDLEEDTFIYDVFYANSEIYYVYMIWYQVAPGSLRYIVVFLKESDGTTYTDEVSLNDVNRFYRGYTSGDSYFYSYTNSLYEFDATADSSSSLGTSGITLMGASDATVQLIWKQNEYEWVIDTEYFYFRKIGASAWSSFTDAGTTTNGIIWDYDDDGNRIINYIIWKDSIYKINEHGMPLRMQVTTVDAYVGWGDWFCNGADTIYELDYADFVVLVCNVSTTIYGAPTFSIVAKDPSFPNQTLMLRDADADLFAIVFVQYSIKRSDNYYEYVCKSPLLDDLSFFFTEDFTTTDQPDILSEGLTNMNYLYDGGNISTTPNTQYTINYQRATINQIRNFGDLIEAYISKTMPDFELRFDNWTLNPWDYKKYKTGVVQWGTSGSPSLGDWTDSSGADCTVSIVAEVDGHKNVMKFSDQSAANNIHTTLPFSATQTTGTVKYYVRGIDVSDAIYLRILNGATIAISMRITGNKIQYRHTAAWNDATGGAVADNTTYIVKLIFDCVADTYDFYLNEVLLDADIPYDTVVASVDSLHFRTEDAATDVVYYIDGLWLSWDGGSAGDNQEMIYPGLGLTEIEPLTTRTLQTPNIQLYGKYENGVQANTIVKGDPTPGLETATFPHIGQTHLDTLGTAIETARNTAFRSIRLSYLGQQIMAQVGGSVLLTYPKESISQETWYVLENVYDAISRKNTVLLVDTEWVPILKGIISQIEVQIDQIATNARIISMTADDTTPDVTNGRFLLSVENTGATAITDLDNPTVGQIITIICNHATNAITITDGGNFALSGNWTPGIDDSITIFVRADNDYIEIGRVNT